jgi:hypothetical protein
MFWRLKKAVFGLVASMPEIICFASIRASAGFPRWTEKSGVLSNTPLNAEF